MGNNIPEKLKALHKETLHKNTPNCIEKNPIVNERVVNLVKESWKLITSGEYDAYKQLRLKEVDADPCLHFYDLFFERLYKNNPEYRDVFRHASSPTKSMAAALFRNVNAALNILTKGKTDGEELKKALKGLSDRLCKHGVKAHYYGPYVAALFDTFKACGVKGETYDAWVHVYSLMFNEMLPHVIIYDYEQEGKVSKALDKEILEAKSTDAEVHKILILGPGEAGKTTLFRQLIHNFGEGFDDDDKRKPLVSAVRVQVVEYIAALASIAQVSAANTDHKDYMMKRAREGVDTLSISWGNALDPAVVASAKALWADPAIQDAYKTRKHTVHVPVACSFYMERIDAIQAKDYIPSFPDILQSRQATTGLVEAAFEVEGEKFKVFDVGGQKNERRKWIHHFEKVDMIVFMVAMDQYDQGLFEQSSINRLTDALELWQQTCNSDFFKNQDIILFLNRIDLLRAKIQESPLKDHELFKKSKLTDHEAKNEESAVNAIRQQFYERSENKSRKITTYITQCTSSENINQVFTDLKNILPRKSKKKKGEEIKEEKAVKLAAVRNEIKEAMGSGKFAF